MSDADSFLRHIRDNPGDDTARLVFADWLDENGDPSPGSAGRADSSPGAGSRAERAEFIRVQIELERVPNDDPRGAALHRREAELFADHATDWARQELPEGMTARTEDTDRSGRPTAFRRGMLARVSTNLQPFLANGAGLVNLPPVEVSVQWLERDEQRNPRPETVRDRVEQLAASPALAHVTHLNLKFNRIGPAGLEVLLDSPHLAPLHELSLGPDQYGEAGAYLLANCARLRGLRKLDVGSCRVGTAGLAALLASPFLRATDDVDLSGSDLDDAAFERLARHEPMREWRALDLSYNESGLSGVRALLTGPHLTRVERLDLSSLIPRPRTWLGDALAREIVRVGLPPSVRQLRMHSSRFTPAAVAELVLSDRLERVTDLYLILNAVGLAGAAAFARSPHLKGLQNLSLYKTELDDTAVIALAASPHLRPVHLDISNNAIGPAGMAALAESEFLSRVVTLGLYENRIGDEGTGHLARAPWLARLSRLNLADCRFGPAGVAALAASPGLGGIVDLGLRGNHVGDEGAIALAGSPHVARLRRLDLTDARIGDVGASALARSPYLNNLRELSFAKNTIGTAARGLLRERFGAGVEFE